MVVHHIASLQLSKKHGPHSRVRSSNSHGNSLDICSAITTVSTAAFAVPVMDKHLKAQKCEKLSESIITKENDSESATKISCDNDSFVTAFSKIALKSATPASLRVQKQHESITQSFVKSGASGLKTRWLVSLIVTAAVLHTLSGQRILGLGASPEVQNRMVVDIAGERPAADFLVTKSL
ncbi:hypothetical protein EVAR_100884_1 [Eumeta japonica]|uniref:Uncharacterized protein n=1 Tax=Eumeta variegata TaxID=151549 RepID=A0A4C2AH46_EUMVA|nr:hypothetical protein EVAR_100884_1 [Eumeta japonica]